jgi:hypothetical protein
MELIETTYTQTEAGFEHTVKFDFEGRIFFALVSETQDETYVRDCFLVLDNNFPIDIPKYFGEYSGDVFTFIYNNIQRGFPS